MSKKFFTPIDLINTSASSGTIIDAPAGVVQWEHTDGTMQIGLRGGSVKLSVGQEQVARVVNKTNEDLLKSQYKAVKVSSAQGQRLAVVLAKADYDINSADTIGLVAEDIAKNQEGYVATLGSIKNINTTGSLQGETWNDGDVLYLSPTVAGRITNIKPQAPQHLVIVGFVIYAHQNNGKIFVKVDNGYEIDELHNIRIISASNNDLLAYDSSASVWKNVPMSSASVGLATLTSQTNFNSLSISGSAVATQAYVQANIPQVAASATYASSANYSTHSGSSTYSSSADYSSTTSQTNFTALSISGSPVATQAYVLANTPSIAASAYYAFNSGSLGGYPSSHYAPIDSPNLTGTPLAPTAASGTNTTQIATTQFVQTAVAGIVDSAPSTLDTLNELAAALGDDPNFATTTASLIGTKAPTNSPTFTGTVNLGTSIATGSVSYANSAGNAVSTSQTNFSALTISGSNVATQAYVLANIPQIAASATFASSANYSNNSGSAAYANNSGNSSTTSQTNFTTLTLSGSTVATQEYVLANIPATSASSTYSASSGYADISGSSTTTSQTDFSALSISGSAVATEAFVLANAPEGSASSTYSSSANYAGVSASTLQTQFDSLTVGGQSLAAAQAAANIYLAYNFV